MEATFVKGNKSAVLAILGSMVAVLGVHEIPQGSSHYKLYVESLIVLRSTVNQASVLLPANQHCIAQKQLCIAIFALASPKNPPPTVSHSNPPRAKPALT